MIFIYPINETTLKNDTNYFGIKNAAEVKIIISLEMNSDHQENGGARTLERILSGG